MEVHLRHEVPPYVLYRHHQVELSDASLVVESGDPSKAEDGGHHQHHSDHRNIAAGGQNNEFKIVFAVCGTRTLLLDFLDVKNRKF